MKTIIAEKGQSLLIVAIAIVVLMGLAALIIDGGSIYLNRRQAQTAADAAALAAAHMLCVTHGSETDAEAIALQYATVENGATEMQHFEVLEDGQVLVQTTTATTSFIASVLGYDTDAAVAEASAGCFNPASTTRMLPIAWTCRPPVGGTNEECRIHSIPWDVFEILLGIFNFDAGLLDEGDGENYGTYYDNAPGDGKMPYLIMDSNSFDINADCREINPFGSITCDFDGDGVMDVEGGANRGWLLLPGTTGASDLTDIMLNGYAGQLSVPHWMPGKDGVANSIFINAHAIRFDVALVPVFNAVCEDSTNANLPADCPTEYEAGDLISGTSGLNTYYRIVGTAPFVVTCVSKGVPEPCPAKTHSGVDANISTIEGYFVHGYVAGDEIDPGGFDLGVYIISLTR